MINIVIYKNSVGSIYGIKVENHGDQIVCSAVSALTMNAFNSIENFTDEHIIVEFDEKGGFLYFEMPEIKLGGYNDSVDLLMRSMLLGLQFIENDYEKDICILYEEVQKC